MKERRNDCSIIDCSVEEKYTEEKFEVVYYYLEDESLWLSKSLKKLGIIDTVDEYTTIYLSEDGYFLSEVINNKKKVIGLSLFSNFENYLIDYYLHQKDVIVDIVPIKEGFFQNYNFQKVRYIEFSYENLFNALSDIPKLIKSIGKINYIELPSNECVLEYGYNTYWLMNKDNFIENYGALFPPNYIKQEATWIGMNPWGNDFFNKQEGILLKFSEILSIMHNEIFTYEGINKIDKQIVKKINEFEMYYKLFPMLYLYVFSHLEKENLSYSVRYVDSIKSWIPIVKYFENRLWIENYIGEYLSEILNDYDDRQLLISLIIDLQELIKR
jgi:hypothetical protein